MLAQQEPKLPLVQVRRVAVASRASLPTLVPALVLLVSAVVGLLFLQLGQLLGAPEVPSQVSVPVRAQA